MINDLIYRQEAIEAMQKLEAEDIDMYGVSIPEGFDGERAVKALKELPSAEPEISRIERELHGKTPEEQYDFIYWLLFKSFEATAYSNSRLAIIEWLRGDKGNG